MENKIVHNDDPMLNIYEAAKYLRVSYRTMQRLTSERLISFNRAGLGKGGKLLFRVSDLEKHIEGRKIKSLFDELNHIKKWLVKIEARLESIESACIASLRH